MEMDVKKSFKNVSVHFQIFKFYNQFRPFLVDVSFSVCDILSKKSASSYYINTMIRVLSKFSNAVKCPLKGHVYARNLEIKYDFFKMFIDEGRYRFNFEFFADYPLDSAGKVTMYLEVFNKYTKPTKRLSNNLTSILTSLM
ncbi:hypothetical protein ACFFRR_006541 [Megaselia abdita]